MSIADKLATVAENEQKVYEAGKTAEWNEFWDVLQQNGTRTTYQATTDYSAFNGSWWTNENFKPKYDIKPTHAGSMFRVSGIKDLRAGMAFNGVKFDFSNCTSLMQMFYASGIVTIGELDFSTRTSGTFTTVQAFQTMRDLETVDLIKVGENVTNYGYWFNHSSKLKEVRFAGTIAYSLSMSGCSVLSVESMKSIISCLKNYAGTENEYTQTLTFPAARWTALEADSTAPNGDTWQEYVGSLGWNVS
jgi:hypothetical protein